MIGAIIFLVVVVSFIGTLVYGVQRYKAIRIVNEILDEELIENEPLSE